MRCGRSSTANGVKYGFGWPSNGPVDGSVAWVLGRRDAATARRLWQALPKRYHRHCWYFTDLFPAHVQALPLGPHRPCPKGEGQTNIVEALNCSLRQRCGVLVRKSCSFSKSLAMHTARIKICIDQHNDKIMLI